MSIRRGFITLSAAAVATAGLDAPLITDAAAASHQGARKPVVTAVVPSDGGTVGYSHVLINGRRLTGATGVTFGGRPAASVRVLSAHQLVAYAPGHVHGVVPVIVRTKRGASPATQAARYTYVHASAPGTWTGSVAPVPSGSHDADDQNTNDTACPSATVCYSVGSVATFTSAPNDVHVSHVPDIVTRSGATTTVVDAPVPAGGTTGGPYARLDAISCPSVTFCAATGEYVKGDDAAEAMLLTLADGTWTAVDAPLPPGVTTPNARTILASVSCGAPGDCVAIGTTGTADSSDPAPGLLYTLHDGAWTVSEAPTPVAATRWSVDQIDCPSASYCLAGASYVASAGPDQPVSHGYQLVLDGGTWAAASIAPASGSRTTVAAVSCPAVRECAMVTLDRYAAGSVAGEYFRTLHAGAWTYAAIPVPADHLAGQGHFGHALAYGRDPLDCPSVSVCYTAEYYQGVMGRESVIARLSGSRVRVHNLPETIAPKTTGTATPTTITDVDCAASSSCTAVGYAGNGGAQQAVYDTFAGGVWTPAVLTPVTDQPSPSVSELTGITCPAIGVCLADGNFAYHQVTLDDGDGPDTFYAREGGLVGLEQPAAAAG